MSGAGFIGLEMVENLHQIGYHVTIVEKAPQVMTVVDAPIAAMVHKQLKDKNVNVLLQTEVTAFDTKEDRIQLTLSDGKQLDADFVILSIGVRPNTSLAADAGLKIGDAGGIWVNEYLQTSNSDIYALGDAIEFPHPLSGLPYCCYLAGPANRQARICADNIVLGNKEKYPGSITTAIAKVFDMTVGSAGLSEHYLQKNNIPYLTSITHPFSHATYYPGAKQMSIKINFAPEGGQLLGAQIVGMEGVDKRLDMMASVMSRGGNVSDLIDIDIEHAYAPPYSSAKEPVAYAAFFKSVLFVTIAWLIILIGHNVFIRIFNSTILEKELKKIKKEIENNEKELQRLKTIAEQKKAELLKKQQENTEN